ncbi:MAG: 4Fe-4S cluster-binding domain-containing protein, partial [Candidatus Diapherotrites archaeon]
MVKQDSENYIPKSFHLQWHITEKCNLKCKHCYSEKNFEKELSLEQLNAILEDYIKTIELWGLSKNTSRITIMGGEPFLRKNFWIFAEKLAGFGKKTA